MLEGFKFDDSLLCNGSVQNGFTKFQKFDFRSQNESKLLHLICLVAVITDAGDAFQVEITSYEATVLSYFSFDNVDGHQETHNHHGKVKKAVWFYKKVQKIRKTTAHGPLNYSLVLLPAFATRARVSARAKSHHLSRRVDNIPINKRIENR